MRWKNGIYVPEPGIGTFERAAVEAKAKSVFLELLGRFNRQERNVSDKPSRSYAPALFAEEPEAKKARR